MTDYTINFGPVQPVSVGQMVEDLGRVFGGPFERHETPGAYSRSMAEYHLNLDLDTWRATAPEGDFDQDHPYQIEIEPKHPDVLRVINEVFHLLKESGRYRAVLYVDYAPIESTHYRPEDIP